MSRFKTISSFARMLITTCDSTTGVITNLGSAAVHATKALDVLAEDMEASVISSTELNALEREQEYLATKAKYALPAQYSDAYPSGQVVLFYTLHNTQIDNLKKKVYI